MKADDVIRGYVVITSAEMMSNGVIIVKSHDFAHP
jgi:hypothetical protein